MEMLQLLILLALVVMALFSAGACCRLVQKGLLPAVPHCCGSSSGQADTGRAAHVAFQ